MSVKPFSNEGKQLSATEYSCQVPAQKPGEPREWTKGWQAPVQPLPPDAPSISTKVETTVTRTRTTKVEK